MDKAQKDLITANRVELVENITVKDGLYSQLIQKKIFSQRTVNRIKCAGADEQQVEELLNEIVKKDCFDLFCQALIDDTQSDVVKKYLKSSTNQLPPTNSSPNTCPDNSAEYMGTPQSDINIQPNLAQTLNSSPSITTDCALGTKRANLSPLLPTTAMLCFRENDNQSITIQYNQTPTKKPRQGDVVLFENDETRYHLKHYVLGLGGQSSDAAQVVNNPQSLSNPNIVDPQRYAAAFKQQPVRLLGAAQVQLSQAADSDIAIHEARKVTEIQNIRNLLGPQNSLNISKMDSNQRNNLKRMEHDSGSKTAVCLGQIGGMSFQKIMPVQETGGGSDSNCDSVDNVSLQKNTILNFHNQITDKGRTFFKATQASDIIKVMPDYYGDKHQVSEGFEDDMSSIDLPDGCVNVKVEHTSKDFFKHNYKKSYAMQRIPRGLALVINVDEVEGKPPRKGTNIDRDNLCSLLTQLHFNILVYNDKDGLTALDIVNKLKSFSRLKEHEAYDACFVCLLSHGEEGYIFGTDGKRIPLEEIFMLFGNTNCKGLIGKPKIFIIQACRGGYLDKGVQLDEPDGGPTGQVTTQLPSMSDMLICYPTQSGYYAWRNRARGSWFIEAIVQVFMRYAKNEDICAMLNRVNYLVSKKVSESNQKEMHNMSQMSEYKSTLRKPHLFFFPGMCVSVNQEM